MEQAGPNPYGIVFLLFVALWIPSALLMAWVSSLRSYLRYIDALCFFPFITLLVMMNILVALKFIPFLLEMTVESQEKGGPRAATPFAFLAAAPIPLGIYILWRWAVRRLDAKLSGKPSDWDERRS